jgi:high affinity Mn2+ porin
VDNPERPADIIATRAYRLKYGICLNGEYEITKGIGIFTRLGWNDGQSEDWAYADVQKAASAGLSIKGDFWHRTNDTVGLAFNVNGISRVQQQFFADGGVGILAGDGGLNYGLEKMLETYYNYHVWKTLHLTADYQFIIDPAYNRARGPVSVLSGRIHWDF